MKELDLLLERWLRTQYAGATALQQAGFEALLELPDPQLRQYLLGAELPADAGMAQAVQGVLASAHIMSPAAVEPSGAPPL
jgi:succinate dehydrogenase flavin-adding protein (antitoxin of CptAB toxin-antitoxin module)